MKLKTVPKNLIFGSSRSMMIGNNILNGKSLNNSVSGASLEDYLALFYAYYKRNYTPEIFIIGLDPWVLIPNSDERWQSIQTDYQKMLKLLNIQNSYQAPLVSTKTLNLVSLSYFQRGIENFEIQLKKRWEKRGLSCFATNETQAKNELIILKDGRHVYAESFRLTPVAEIEKNATKYGNTKPAYHLESFANLDKERQKTCKIKV